MTDTETIKELEKALKVAEETINRQKTEIERLKDENKKQEAVLEEIDNTIYPFPFETDYDKAIKKAKAEAVKEFAEILKGDAVGWLEITVDDIDEASRKVLNRK